MPTTQLPEAPMSTTRTRNNRKSAQRPEQLAAEAALTANTAEVRPVVTLTPEAQARLEKEKAKLAKEQRAADNRARRIAALEAGEELPSSSKGLPPVVKMNELGGLARQLHRACLLAVSDEAVALMRNASIGDGDITSAGYALRSARDEAIARWLKQFEQRAAAGAADNDTLAPLGLTREDGEWVLVEKKKSEAEKSEAA
jgi:hypothetical protein